MGNLRCKACRQLKSAEVDLAKAQVMMRDQSLAISKSKGQTNGIYNQLQKAKRDLREAMIEIGRLTSELSAKGAELRKVKEQVR